ncbi:disulfide bond formation protein B [Novosphingobium sp. KCTC 2891]|uniref:disulfide bond formation protein B n=1 Tax=Novosphingobium sp. KCTC 2891 TaxID=2989730 RepID=UPI002222CB73|nr:disulfide bond formation protein B [Novosphingobium sp. KCTC 2891]MCW1382330.1 disulfide bond formation protein B [Novosphingobium sp. KCTC 2891]
MTPQQSRSAAYTLVLLVPAALMGGALISQYVFGLYPCQMCWWQRYPHIAAIVLALLALVMRGSRLGDALVRLAALAVLASGAIGAFHAGVEYGWWQGITTCARTSGASGDPLAAIMNAPIIRCDVAPWSLFGISLAGYNFLISVAGALAVFALLGRGNRRPA